MSEIGSPNTREIGIESGGEKPKGFDRGEQLSSPVPGAEMSGGRGAKSKRRRGGSAGMDALMSMFGPIKEGTKTVPTPDLMKYLHKVEIAETGDLNWQTAESDLRRVLNQGEYSPEFSEAINTWIGLLRLDKAMADGGGRYERIEEVMRSRDKYEGYVTKPGISRLLKMDKQTGECFRELLGLVGIETGKRKSKKYNIDGVFDVTTDQTDDKLEELKRRGYDSTRVTAAYAALRTVGAPQGIDHAQFVISKFIKTGDLDKEDLGIWILARDKKLKVTDYGIDLKAFQKRNQAYYEERRMHGKKCEWYTEGWGGLKDIFEMAGWEAFLKALKVDNRRGALFKYWEDNKKRRGTLLAVAGNRNRSTGKTFEERKKEIITNTTQADQVDWLFDESPMPDSETVQRLNNESKIAKDPPTVSLKPSMLAAEEVAVRSIAQDIGRATKAVANPVEVLNKSPLGALKRRLRGE